VGIAVVDAVKLAKDNKRTYEGLVARHEALLRRMAAETEAQQRARSQVYDDALVPFREVFARLKNVDMAELAEIDALPGGALPDAGLRQRLGVSVAQAVGAVAGGAVAGVAAGAGASAATFAAVGAFATASTGAAISGLSGAAASSATLAWLGGGSVAAGGGGVVAGTTVLAGVVAAPMVLVATAVVTWQGRRARNGQQEAASQLVEAEAELGIAEVNAARVRRRSRQVRDILKDLRGAMLARLPEVAAMVAVNPDYATYTPAQRTAVARLVGIATTTVTVLSTPIADDDGVATEESLQVVLDAKQYLIAMACAS
jgi:hypothetical protein